MATKTTKKKGETSTTVAVGIRIDPKMKYALDMLARVQKRSLTAVIEWAIESAIAQKAWRDPYYTFEYAIEAVWSTDEPTRFVRQAIHMPETLTYDELRVWETVKLTPEFWSNIPTSAEVDQSWVKYEHIQAHWDALLKHVQENKNSPTVVAFNTAST
ncbi:hypothetical protein ACQKFE_07335 [Stutzerimonas stutzeri]|uniref:hypothetical protein n=1 Tax=Stutzerimonas stutzeri TaxID=316 RepID=UPI003D08E9B0